LEIVAPVNCLIEQIIAVEDSVEDADGYISSDDWDTIVEADLPLYAQAAEADVAFMEALVAYDWPDIVHEDVQSLIEESSAIASWSRRIAESKSFDEFAEWWGNPPEFVAGAVVRAKLGLESNIGSEVVDCPAA
jgi:hypothetical protein